MPLPDGPDALSVAFRAVSFVLLLNAAGIPIFIAAFGHFVPGIRTVSRLGWKLAAGALLFVTGHHALEAARMAGDMSGVMDPEMQRMALLSPPGAAFALRMVGLMLVLAGLAWIARRLPASEPPPPMAPGLVPPGPVPPGLVPPGLVPPGPVPPGLVPPGLVPPGLVPPGPVPPGPVPPGLVPPGPVPPGLVPPGPVPLSAALIGSILAVTAFTVTGHTSVTPHRVAAATLLAIHLLVVAFWLGALWPLFIVAAREPPATVARAVDAFSLVAAWVVPAILLAGVALTVLLVPGWSVFKQPYGLLLLAKLTSFIVLMAMASLNKWRFGPDCAKGNTRAFKRTVVIEYVLICLVLAITAAMTTFFSPEAA
jgi:Copper resistance protein D